MLTIISLIVSGILSNVPLLIKLFDRKQVLSHELELAKYRHTNKMRELEHESDVANTLATYREGESLRAHDSSIDGSGFLNALRTSIRPVITYLFFFLFLTIKIIVLYELVYVNGIDIVNAVKVLWDDPAQATFGAIMGFWFGGRAIERYGGYGVTKEKSKK